MDYAQPPLLRRIFDTLDPRLSDTLRAEFERRRREPPAYSLPDGAKVVLCGHRAAGKTSLLPRVAALLGTQGVDLDRLLERQSGRKLLAWVREDEPGFRAAERAAFVELPPGTVVAVGGGFLALHSDLLKDAVAVLVPVTFETYRERLLRDRSRPRLRPHLPIEEEIAQVYREREALHAKAGPLPLVDFLIAVTNQGGR